MTLPLLTRAIDGDTALVDLSHASIVCGVDAATRMPARRPAEGEQYRFHFDMSRCIGCQCCVVACNEQNGNPAAINWRRVGEIEGGWYPHTRRAYLSMGCNHCVEPTCLSGCPVDAYTKDPQTGIVRHSAEACIGCQYCTWNCSYGVPQYNPDRGVVGKCDMCHGRLALGQAPACVSACPQQAIQIEIVHTKQWGRAYDTHVPGRGIPVADGSVSTTRVTLPPELPPNARPVNLLNVRPEAPHWPLVIMTVLTQVAVGAFITIWTLDLFGREASLGAAALTSWLVAALALTASTLHLGRPIHAYRALKMWRRSWLSREVLLFTAFSAVASLYASALWFGWRIGAPLGALTALLGIAGVTASACIYRVDSRPAWNTPYTLVQFSLTGAALGPLLVAAIGVSARPVLITAAAMSGAQLVLLALRFLRLVAAGSIELQGTARLLSTTLQSRVIARVLLLGVGGVVLPLVAQPPLLWAALPLAFAGEVLGRYLFFVSVVPRHMAAPYLDLGSEAA